MGTPFDRCPRCRQVLAGFSVYRCPACETAFCAGCDREERPVPEVGWLAAAISEADLDSCPVCTGAITPDDHIGLILPPRH